ncbi:putative DNA polymerase IV [Nitrospira japonica]|uniref:Putative DNA polymerase IV n=1 Tax=Nitrospira japonica TaxID=1325564 RepID=A0A1W1I4K0_9BACT|nr:hypothetical protein [Nitrospira japonica]SLM47932.1 putative DNA polymerase IV [Nitrospira japonica]
MDRHIAYVQIPCFGIALAQATDPVLRNRPVVLAPLHTPRALVLEASREAMQEGVRPGIPIELARRLCPNLRLIPPDLPSMRAAHRSVQRTVLPFAPAWESIGLGALFLDLTGTARCFGPPIDTVSRLGRALTRQQGLQTVIGLAGSKLVSQLAATSLTASPHILSIQAGSEQSFLAPLPAAWLPGLQHHARHVRASHILQRLEDLNLKTMGAVSSVPLVHLQSAFGAAATWLHDWASGVDPSPVRSPADQPAIEQSLGLNPDEIDDDRLLKRLYVLLENLCATLRQQGRVCRRLQLLVRHSDHQHQLAQQRLHHATCWEADLQPVLRRLFIRCFRRRVRLQHVTLQVDQLESPIDQLELFETWPASTPPVHQRLSLAVDRIRAKFGVQAVSWGAVRP